MSELNMQIETVAISKIKPNPNNPRVIRDESFKKLVQSIKQFPEMLAIRPIVVNDSMCVLGGNMRLRACKEAGLKEVYIINASSLTTEQQKEFIIKDNNSAGDWDWELLATNFDAGDVESWGLEIPEQSIQDTKKASFSRTVTLSVDADEFDQIKAMLEMAKKSNAVNVGNILLSSLKEALKNEFF